MQVSIIKIGGNVIDFPEKLDEFLYLFSKFPGKKILVHGGGVMASKFGESMGVMPQMIDGRRITDKDTLEIVTMVYAGLINKQIVAKLQGLKQNALGMTGADGNLIQSRKRPVKSIDYGFVGDIQSVNIDLIQNLLNEDIIPVVCAITHDKKGQLLNTNADSIASEMATSLSKKMKVDLYFCFNKSGVLIDEKNDSSIIPLINEDIYTELRKENVIHSGMIPKLDNAFAALNKGVNHVWIGKAENLLLAAKGKVSGTNIETHKYDLY
ncbi:Acetylglutamate kinase [Indibacter alkaliphilus LW1]|jgi:acetylglutamate kinase|uniref:Acetylglutamate kinase n=1 Tax=Indibacter alkaliphilus (strain CCUG 57479 / KCTC 22604 / LW1) TaxID=1189612 RepID=S2DV34_INDAL|nr:acetylglutamate kinase [Indibacter alkaliphilus]EOZ93708.1 Acetylglutamate kinase [Indibacter alkaliphilus LW1]